MSKEEFKNNIDSDVQADAKSGKDSKAKNRRGKRGKRGNSGKPNSKRGNVNDTAYYYTDPNVLASVTNFSFTEFLGVPAEIGAMYHDTTDTGEMTLTENVANVIAFRMNPSVQPTAAEGSTGAEAINTVALRNYTGLTAGNGKTSQYAASDPMMAVLGIGSAVSMYSHLKRAFQCYQLVNQRNREYPRLLYRAMGIDWDDFKANIANYRDQFNLLVCQFDKIPIFDSITYLDKCRHMYEYIYVDEDSPLAQTYLFTPYSVWTLDEAYDPSGSGLVTTNLYDGVAYHSMAYLLEVFASQIQALTTSSTLNYVYSDILRLISNGKGHSFLLETIPLMPDPNYGPVINDEIRHWINNMMIVGAPVDKDAVPSVVGHGTTNSNDVASDGSTGCLLYHPTFVLNKEDSVSQENAAKFRAQIIQLWYANNFINFDSMVPSIDDKVAATRLAVRANVQMYTDASNANKPLYTYANDIDLGDYYCVSMVTFTDIENVSGLSSNIQISKIWNNATWANMMWRADYLSKLKYAPRMAIADGEYITSTGENALKCLTGDLTYYTLLPHTVTKRMKDAEMFGLFDFRMNF